MLIFLLIAAAFAFYVMNTDERKRVLQWILAASVVIRRLALRIALLLLAGMRTWARAIHAKNRLAQAAAIALLFVASVGTIVLTRPAPADVRPEIERLLAVESQTTAIYDAAAAQFKRGTLDSESLARIIEGKIKPQLQGVRVRLMSIDNVRSDHQPLLEKAREYLRLRDESWRMRAEALHRRDLKSLQRVELTERASLAALTAAAEAMKQL
jgi:hypothetical protein